MSIVNVSTIINKMPIKERIDGRFEGRITIERKRKSFYGQSKAEVKRKAKEYLTKVENGYRDPQKITLDIYFEYWMKKFKKNKIEDSSYTIIYRTYINQIQNTLGNKKMGEITTKHIQDLIDERANPTNKKTTPLVHTSLKKIYYVLKPCFQQAVKDEVISINPCEDVILPKRKYTAKQSKEQISLSDEEIQSFKTAALQKQKTSTEYSSRTAIVLLIILNLGLRGGEMLVLEWSDINFEEKIVTINKTLQTNVIDFGKNESFHDMKDNYEYYSTIKDSTKTKSGERVLPLNETTLFYLSELQKYDERHKINSDFVACNRNGGMLTLRALEKSMYRLIRISGINSQASPHTLRHTFGSVLLRKGVNIEVVSRLMGHSDVSITYRHYIHVLQEEIAKQMNLVQIA